MRRICVSITLLLSEVDVYCCEISITIYDFLTLRSFLRLFYFIIWRPGYAITQISSCLLYTNVMLLVLWHLYTIASIPRKAPSIPYDGIIDNIPIKHKFECNNTLEHSRAFMTITFQSGKSASHVTCSLHLDTEHAEFQHII